MFINGNSASCFSAVVLSVSGLLLVFTIAVLPAVADEIEIDEIEYRELPQETEIPETVSPETVQPDTIVSPEPDETTGSIYNEEPVEPVEMQPFRLLDSEVPAGTMQRLSWYTSETLTGLAQATPVLVSHGVGPGPRLCIIAAVHGDELNGIEIVRSLLYGLN